MGKCASKPVMEPKIPMPIKNSIGKRAFSIKIFRMERDFLPKMADEKIIKIIISAGKTVLAQSIKNAKITKLIKIVFCFNKYLENKIDDEQSVINNIKRISPSFVHGKTLRCSCDKPQTVNSKPKLRAKQIKPLKKNNFI